MTTCAECLTALSTMRLAEIGEGSPIRQHYSTCPDCSRIAEDLQYAEHRLALALSEMGSSLPPELIARDAITGSERLRRRTMGKWIRIGLGIFAALILGSYVVEQRAVLPRREIITRTIVLKCASTDVATEVVTPYLRSHGAAVYGSRNASLITIRGINPEVEAAISQIDQLEARSCAIPQPTTPVTPSGETRGKD